MPEGGVEPPPFLQDYVLNVACLPIPPLWQVIEVFYHERC